MKIGQCTSGLETAMLELHKLQLRLPSKSGIYKGGSCKTTLFKSGTRRFLDENMSNATIGFRCTMDRVGSPVGLGAYE